MEDTNAFGNITEYAIGVTAIAMVVFIMAVMTNAMSNSSVYNNAYPKVETISQPV